MKNKYIAIFISFIGLMSSCSVTDIDPIDSLTDQSYWRSVADLQMYAEGFYGNLSAPDQALDTRSDDRLSTTYNSWLYDEATLPTSASSAGWSWTNLRNLNFYMARYEKVEGDAAAINKWTAVIRFFRALDYYGKIRTFGDVPWYDKDLATSDAENLYKARDSYDLILTKIIEDLEFAIAHLPEKNETKSGELNKDAARTQLSRVCLYYGTFKKYHGVSTSPTSNELLTKAAAVAYDVMSSGRYAIVKGTDAGASQKSFEGFPLYYSNQFTQEDLANNAECILPRIYVADVLMHQLGRQAGSNGFTKDFAESYLCKDGLPIANSPLYQGDETLDTEMTNRDPRMYQTIDNIHRPFSVQSDGEQQVNHSVYNENASAPSVAGSSSVTGYPVVKFRSADPAQFEASRSTYDWFVYRYAEVLLNYAEAKYELGQCTQEVLDQTINLLRDRVEMPHLTVNPVADKAAVNYGYDVTPLLYEIRRERRVELAAEGFRYDDIIRWKATKLFENPKTVLGIRVTDAVIALYQDGTFGGTNGRQLATYDGKQYVRPYAKDLNDASRAWKANDRRFLSPLPLDELLLNPNLKQNPGWE
ncbi:RagB/SusD family nutrient uptake outer membrane protein [Parabacteroides sp. OttesenSCG-928-K15]|nr:RagB/SusD family nutrient uptake outer membrane protein [Parabacteroides sp. OttesenSCG-928-K15]